MRSDTVSAAVVALLAGIPWVLTGAPVNLNSFSNGDVADAGSINANFAAINAELGRIDRCILKQAQVSGHSQIPNAVDTWYKRRYSTLEGNCDYITPGSTTSDALFVGGSFFDTLTVDPGKYFVRFDGQTGQDSGYNRIKLVRETPLPTADLIAGITAYTNGGDARNLIVFGEGFLEFTVATEISVQQVHSKGTETWRTGHSGGYSLDEIYAHLVFEKVE